MGLQVIGVGFGRTGTQSLKAALERLLGGRCYHMEEVARRHPEHAALWIQAAAGRLPDWDAMFAEYAAGVDWPVAAFWRELHQQYPDARLILTLRDPDRWYDSVYQTSWEMTRHMTAPPVSWWLRLLGPRRRFTEMALSAVWDREFQGRFADRAHAIRVYHQRIEEIRATIPPEQLLVYEVRQGWGPLCDFLGLPVPDAPFPSRNSAAEFRRYTLAMRVAAWGTLAGVAAAILLIGWRLLRPR